MDRLISKINIIWKWWQLLKFLQKGYVKYQEIFTKILCFFSPNSNDRWHCKKLTLNCCPISDFSVFLVMMWRKKVKYMELASKKEYCNGNWDPFHIFKLHPFHQLWETIKSIPFSDYCLQHQLWLLFGTKPRISIRNLLQS